jgi:hypothetical protein
MSSPETCLKCPELIPPERRADSRYCSQVCKRAGEYERRRLQRRLEVLETGLSTARAYRFPRQQVARLQDEVSAAEARLRALLGG